MLERFNMKNTKPITSLFRAQFKLFKKSNPSPEKQQKMSVTLYFLAVGSLMYAIVCIRPDIAYVVGVVSRFLANTGKKYWKTIKWIFRYLKGTSKLCLCFENGKPILRGYTNEDMAGDLDG